MRDWVMVHEQCHLVGIRDYLQCEISNAQETDDLFFQKLLAFHCRPFHNHPLCMC